MKLSIILLRLGRQNWLFVLLLRLLKLVWQNGLIVWWDILSYVIVLSMVFICLD